MHSFHELMPTYFPIAGSVGGAALDAGLMGVSDNVLKYFLYPLFVFIANTLYKTISEIRTEHLSQVRLVKGMIAEIDTMRESQQKNSTVFSAAYAEGDTDSRLARKVAADAKYFPYSVKTTSTTSVFASDPMPAKSFAFLPSETMARLTTFHDQSSLLDSSIADMREDVFRELDPERKLAAFGKVVDLFEKSEAAYAPCRRALVVQDRRMTTTSLTWMILFPILSGSLPIWAVTLWIILNVLWHWLVRG